jgi:hypothetical protein
MSTDLYVDKVLKWREQTLREKEEGVVVPYWKSISTAARNAAPTHCGPHGSYPLGPGCAHVASARHLADTGHGSPNKQCIESYAARHGCGGSS